MFVKAIPSVLTLGNMVIGMVAILLSSQGRLNEAALLVVIGMLLDGLDGRVARLLGAESEFGKQLDSLSDIVTFGVAPSVIMYHVILRQMGLVGEALAVLFPLCGALRLARFNVQTKSTSFFVGLPITAAGGVLATMALSTPVLHPAGVILPCGMLILAFLMVSNVRYPNFKRVAIPSSSIFLIPVFIVLISVVIHYQVIPVDWLLFGIFAIYALYGITRSVRYHMTKRKAFEEEALDEDDELEPGKTYNES